MYLDNVRDCSLDGKDHGGSNLVVLSLFKIGNGNLYLHEGLNEMSSRLSNNLWVVRGHLLVELSAIV